MSYLPFLFIPALIYAVPLSLGLFIVTRVMRQRFSGEYLVYALVPICSWLLFAFLRDKGKSLSNVVVEPLLLAAIVFVLISIYSFLNKRGMALGSTGQVIAGAVFGCLIASAVYLLVPALPE